MDYAKNAIDISSETFRRLLLEQLGDPEMGNSQFSDENLFDSLKDTRYYALGEHAARAFVEKAVEPQPWIEQVSDCDTKTLLFAADCARFANRCGFQMPLALGDLWYVSKSLGDPANGRMDGYHSAPLIVVRTADDDLKALIVQPPTQRLESYDDARFQDPEDEVRFWVFFTSLG